LRLFWCWGHCSPFSFMWTFSQHSRRFSSRGFTLIELLVVMGIMLVITTVLLFRQSSFDSSTVLRSLAYSVALSVRQAQVYGTSVVGTTTASTNCVSGFYNAGNCYASAYGLYFSNASPSSYSLFADLNGDGQYESAETAQVFTLGTGYTVANACVLNAGSAYCTAACPTTLPFGLSAGNCNPTSITSVTVLFHRPNPDACIDDGQGLCGPGTHSTVLGGAYIQLQAGGDTSDTKSVSVLPTGEVSVCSATNC
jgi:prepilin-type N-terminal cleavage/methylation domain-containing protein